MSHPIDIIANAIRAADEHDQNQTADALARFVAEALADEAVVANAIQALIADGWRHLTDEDLAIIAWVVLRSVAGE
jgi:hypothetical protein